jgi:hypothetical protein
VPPPINWKNLPTLGGSVIAAQRAQRLRDYQLGQAEAASRMWPYQVKQAEWDFNLARPDTRGDRAINGSARAMAICEDGERTD